MTPLTVQRAIQPPPRAIAPVVHQHIHFHGVSAEDIATIMARQESPARPAIEKE
ncbi:MAG TPA: hypothetical protein VMV92_39220 [Streptosporangiaceae bacterium]|nr:hypothetical protein [Streptosporangiaceae bacterium]